MANLPLILQPVIKYVDFQGRARRAEFWPYYLVLMVFYYGLSGWMVASAFAGGRFDPAAMIRQFVVFVPLLCLVGLGLFLPTYAVMVRRLHDSNRTGWWVLLPFAASAVGQSLIYIFQGQAIMRATLDMQAQMQSVVSSADAFDFGKIMALEWPIMRITLPWSLGTSLAAYLVLWVLWAMPGTRGPNRFGADPKAG